MSRALLLLSVCFGIGVLAAQDKPVDTPAGPVPLNRSGTILLDKPGNRLLLKTRVCLREGVLEMLACPKQTKEHESILSFDGPAEIVHAGLLALGAKPGGPARFEGKYQPPTGQKIEIFAVWKDASGREQRVPAQTWIRHATSRYFEAPLDRLPFDVVLERKDDSLRYDSSNKLLLWFGTMAPEQRDKSLKLSDNQPFRKAVQSLYQQSQPRELKAEFVFVGSRFAKLDDGTERYLANDGSLICVANFSDAMIDINIQSSADNAAGLLFEPWTDRVPPVDTPVTLELVVVPTATPETPPK